MQITTHPSVEQGLYSKREIHHDWETTYDNDLPFRGNIARNTSTFPKSN